MRFFIALNGFLKFLKLDGGLKMCFSEEYVCEIVGYHVRKSFGECKQNDIGGEIVVVRLFFGVFEGAIVGGICLWECWLSCYAIFLATKTKFAAMERF